MYIKLIVFNSKLNVFKFKIQLKNCYLTWNLWKLNIRNKMIVGCSKSEE